MEANKTGLRSAAILILATLAAISLSSCPQNDSAKKLETLVIGVPPLEQNALLYIAEQKGFFAKNGLRVEIRDFSSGRDSLKALVKNEVDISGSSEFPFVKAVFQKNEIRIIACSNNFEDKYILARKDLGIKKATDLKGKRIGVALNTISEFYLGRFLVLHGMKLRDIALVDLRPDQFEKSMVEGTVDAIIAWQPYVSRIQKEVEGLITWQAQCGQAIFGVLVCRNSWISDHSTSLLSFLKSLKQAEDYLVRHPAEVRSIIAKRLNYDDSYVDQFWPRHQFLLSLDQTLIVAMKDEAQWLMKSILADQRTMPDFTNFIYSDLLKSTKPESVNIIR